jgi:hypothetical protein
MLTNNNCNTRSTFDAQTVLQYSISIDTVSLKKKKRPKDYIKIGPFSSNFFPFLFYMEIKLASEILKSHYG